MEEKIFCFVNTVLGFKENELKPKNLCCVQGPLRRTSSTVSIQQQDRELRLFFWGMSMPNEAHITKLQILNIFFSGFPLEIPVLCRVPLQGVHGQHYQAFKVCELCCP